jgi:tyrosine-protein kinase Etk/Wzc
MKKGPVNETDFEDDDGNELQFSDIVAQILARKWLVILALAVGGLIGLAIGQLPPDQYRSSALVHIEQRNQGIDLPEILVGRGLNSSGGRNIATESHIIKSRFTLWPVVQELNLDWRVEPKRFPVVGHMVERRSWPAIPNWIFPAYTRHGDVIRLDLLEVDGPLIGRRAVLTVTGEDSFDISFGTTEGLSGRVGETVSVVPGFRFRISRLEAPEGRQFMVWRSNELAALGQARRGLIINERPPRNSGIVDFIYESEDPQQTVEMANTIVKSYQRQNLSRKSAEIDQSIAFIENQLPRAREQTAEAAEKLNEFRRSSQASELTAGSQQLLQRIVSAEAELEELKFRKEQLLQRLTENHPDIQELSDRQMRIEERLAEMRQEANELPPLEQELLTLTQRLERAIEIERQLAGRAEELNVVRASAVSNINILEPAVRASRIGPDRTRPIFVGLAVALVLSVLGILVRNYMRRGIDDSREIEELGLPLFATINKVEGLRPGDADSELYPLAKSNPNDIVVEALRGLRTGLQFSLATAPSKSLMITSPAPSQGKSFISLNLGIVSAQVGSRVLLIDADMRKGRLRKQFKLPRKHVGLSDYLANEAKLSDVLISDEETGLDFIPTGRYPPNSADLLTTAAFRDLLGEAADHYDLVIVDSPPILAVTDPGIIGQLTGMTLMVVKHLETTRAEVQSAQKIMSNSGIKMSGAILNQFDVSASSYGQYGHGHYGGYKYHYN